MSDTEGPQRIPVLRILHVEDDPNDAELVALALERDGLRCTIQRVDGSDALRQALAEGSFDLVLSDYSLPGFNGLAALKLVRELAPNLPFVLVSGTLGEDAAVESVRSGATDYVLKHRLERLADSIRRALAEAEERRARIDAEAALLKSEAQLRQSQKMEAIGLLAGGIAHDFNNLLMAIVCYSESARTRDACDLEIAGDLDEVEKAANRAAALTRQLLAFSRQQLLAPRVLDLNEILVNVDKMLRRLIGEDIDVRTVSCPDLGYVTADPGQMEQVLLNLAVNARDAMPSGGKLTIETSNVVLDAVSIPGAPGLQTGTFVMLAVTDNGIGMDEDTRRKMFDPFFTTKEVGRGTGLGLATVDGIVRQSGGHIEVYSEVGQGTTFKIYLPRVSARPESVTNHSPVANELRGSETILVVEDEELVRRVVCDRLRSHGYRVLAAGDRAEALAMFERCMREGAPPDLMLSDLVMPGMPIPEFDAALARLDPDLKVVYMSGYTDRAMHHQGALEPTVPYLQKPFSPSVLLQTLREVLDTPRAKAA